MDSNGEWNFDWLGSLLPHIILKRLMVIHPPMAEIGVDVCL